MLLLQILVFAFPSIIRSEYIAHDTILIMHHTRIQHPDTQHPTLGILLMSCPTHTDIYHCTLFIGRHTPETQSFQISIIVNAHLNILSFVLSLKTKAHSHNCFRRSYLLSGYEHFVFSCSFRCISHISQFCNSIYIILHWYIYICFILFFLSL